MEKFSTWCHLFVSANSKGQKILLSTVFWEDNEVKNLMWSLLFGIICLDCTIINYMSVFNEELKYTYPVFSVSQMRLKITQSVSSYLWN